MDSYISHHGILGMKWGIRRYQPYGTAYIRKNSTQGLDKTKVYSSNLNKWGKTKDNNILYITGFSGSGKSTIATKLKSKNTNVVHIDSYMEKDKHGENSSNQNKDLNEFLDRKNFDVSKLSDTSIDRKERWKYIDDFAENLLQDFAKEQHSKGKRVIVEGVQLSDDTMFPVKDFFKDKPVLMPTTGKLTSMYRSGKRDGMNLKDRFDKESLEWYKYADKRLSELRDITDSKKTTIYIDSKNGTLISNINKSTIGKGKKYLRGLI